MSEEIKSKLETYKRSYYKKELIRGVLITTSIFIFTFFVLNALEARFWFSSHIRLLFFLILSGVLLMPLIIFVVRPLLGFLNLKQFLSDDEASKGIGQYFPEISDHLTNFLELQRSRDQNASLLSATLVQREQKLTPFDFKLAIDFRSNRKYLKWFFLISGIASVMWLVYFHSFSQSAQRIVSFRQEYVKPAPFDFVFDNQSFHVFKNENFDLSVRLTGSYIPEHVYVELENSRRIKLEKDKSDGRYKHTFHNVQQAINFRLEAAGYHSAQKTIDILNRPELSGFSLQIDYPEYTSIPDERQLNIGNAFVPEGTSFTWQLETRNVDSAHIVLNEQKKSMNSAYPGKFEYNQKILEKTNYELKLSNEFGKNAAPITYTIETIPDEKPVIEIKYLADTILYSSVLMVGQLRDDYGFSKLVLHQKAARTGKTTHKSIKINTGTPNQQFTELWTPENPKLADPEPYELWFTVYDNDGVNGAKATDSERFYFKPINASEKSEIVSQSFSDTKGQLEKSERKSEALNKKLDDLQNRMRSRSQPGWQEEKLMREMLEEKKALEKSIQSIKEKYEELMQKQEEFGEKSESLKQKSEELNKLLEEILDDETKKLYEELQKLLAEKQQNDQLNDKLSQINRKEKNLEKEIERALELFKRLQRDSKMESTANALERLAEKQQELSEKSPSQNPEESQAQQEEINEEFQEVAKDLEEIEKLNEELKDGGDISQQQQQQKELEQKLEEISQNLEQKAAPDKTSKQQQNASDQMKQMADQLKTMQASMEMEMLSENIENLEDILDNLIKSSMEQERITQNFRGVAQSDPRFLKLSQDQLQLVENVQVIQDSLVSLAHRVPKMSNFITREIDQINHSLDQAFAAIKERSVGKATSHQQFAMTSMNNLALLLDELLQKMQMAMSEAKAGQGKPQKQSKPTPSMGELQQQLSQQIEELQKSGKSGRSLSEELARLAAEQARIREEMEALKKKLDGQNPNENGGAGKALKEAIEQMEQNEVDLVNKRLNQNLLNRQKEITTRMLEIEKATKEQDTDDQREAEKAKEHKRQFPPAFEEYLKARKSEIELLNTIPLDLNPFYKKEVNDYFRRLSVEEK